MKVYWIFIAFLLLPWAPAFSQSETIKIGFLIRDKKDIATRQAVELAIEHANNQGRYQGRKFELITKSCDGPWGISSKQAVNLVYDDEVALIVAALDGRNAHLAEQVTAKSQMVLLSTQSSDPTLSRAYVPWYFRMVPDDKQQSIVLVEEIYKHQKFNNVALIAMDGYDGKMSVESMSALIKENGYAKPEILVGLSENELMQKIMQHPWQGIVLAGNADNTRKIIEKTTMAKPNTKIYAFQNVHNFMNDHAQSFESKLQPTPFVKINGSKKMDFEKTFKEKYHGDPSPSLAYVYDGILLATQAVRKLGSDPEALRNGFKTMEYNGITGKIKFGKMGNRQFD